MLVRVLAWDGRLLDVPAAEKGLCTNLDWCHFWYVQASRVVSTVRLANVLLDESFPYLFSYTERHIRLNEDEHVVFIEPVR